MGQSNITLHCIVLQVLHSVLKEVAIKWVLKHYNILHCSSRATYCSHNFLMMLPLNGSLKHYATLHCSSSATFCS